MPNKEPTKTEPNECEKAKKAYLDSPEDYTSPFKAGWTAGGKGDHGQLNTDAFNLAIAKKDNARMASEIDRLQSMLKKQEPATEKTAEPDAGTTPVWTAHGMTKEEWIENMKKRQQWCISGGQSEIKPDTFSDRLNALAKALEALRSAPSYWANANESNAAYLVILAAIARECGGAK